MGLRLALEYRLFFGGKLPRPSSNAKLILMSHLGQNVGLGGWVGGKFPRIFTDMVMILFLLSL